MGRHLRWRGVTSVIGMYGALYLLQGNANVVSDVNEEDRYSSAVDEE